MPFVVQNACAEWEQNLGSKHSSDTYKVKENTGWRPTTTPPARPTTSNNSQFHNGRFTSYRANHARTAAPSPTHRRVGVRAPNRSAMLTPAPGSAHQGAPK